MQTPDGRMRALEQEEIQANPMLLKSSKVLEIGKYFKIKRCYFKITCLTPEGIEAKGVSKREYFDNRR